VAVEIASATRVGRSLNITTTVDVLQGQRLAVELDRRRGLNEQPIRIRAGRL